jgi:hypothetical protein
MKGVPSIPAVKIEMMESSRRCLVFGLLGLLPVIGLPFALIAGWHSGQARSREKYHWNPAHQLRILGLTCAVVGVLGWGFLDILVLWQIWNNVVGGVG